MTRFTADPNAAWEGCCVKDPGHSTKPGRWPSGEIAPVCSAHMANWHAAHDAMKVQALRPAAMRPRFLGGK